MEAIRAHRKKATVHPVHRKIKPELIMRESTAMVGQGLADSF